MNGFLVLLCHSMDDIPIGLYATHEEAEGRAAALDEMPGQYYRKLFSTDVTTPVCIKIIEFRGGLPVRVELARVFEHAGHTAEKKKETKP